MPGARRRGAPRPRRLARGHGNGSRWGWARNRGTTSKLRPSTTQPPAPPQQSPLLRPPPPHWPHPPHRRC
eukprot:10418711-Lingulodinium_polyedra.AAC.1